MSLLIDGFNLIYKFPELESMMYYGKLNTARSGLLEKLKEYQKIKKTVIRVVFDGKKDKALETASEKIGKIDVFYSLDYSADYLIKQFIKKDINPKMTIVVTSDKDIINYVTRRGAKNITSEKFSEIVTDALEECREEKELEKEISIKENPSVTEEEISYWQRLFRKNR